MNERIWKIYGEALLGTSDNGGDVLDPIKFAELIVKECYALVDYENKQFIKAQFKEHFGVEE